MTGRWQARLLLLVLLVVVRLGSEHQPPDLVFLFIDHGQCSPAEVSALRRRAVSRYGGPAASERWGPLMFVHIVYAGEAG